MQRMMTSMDKTTVHFIGCDSCEKWFKLRMQYTSKLLFVMGVTLCISLKDSDRVSKVMLSLVLQYTIDLDMMISMVYAMFTIESQMVQVERLFMMQNIPQEKTTGHFPPQHPCFQIQGRQCVPKEKLEWPEHGKIEFKDVCLRYRANTDVVLRRLSFSVDSGLTVGIVGRTGAGKSTTGIALARICELESGSITIDGVDISNVKLNGLRQMLTIIPQDPVLFTGTLRFNLDPFEREIDSSMLALIQRAGLSDLVTSKVNLKADETETRNGLDMMITENGANLSVGERQLICICRAILRKNNVVVLDEATANIDVVTEQTIQRLINEEFKSATVLIIAHRLNTIIASDKILVLDQGKVVEYDTPSALIQNPDSNFNQFLNELKKKEKEETK